MDIIVPIKQVPETGNVRIDEEKGTMIREGVESIVNPLDLHAIEVALQLKENPPGPLFERGREGRVFERGRKGRVTVISMGPRNAEKAIREAISMGCDDGVLISDRAFAGSDTWATSYTLSSAIKQLGNFDLIITGLRATDGDTGQVGPGIAAFLGLPLSTYTSGIKEITDNTITVERLVEAGYETLRLPLPCLLTVVIEISYPRLPTLRSKQRSRSKEVPVWGPEDLNVDARFLGLKGSPVKVVKISRPKVARNGRIVDAGKLGIKGAVRELVDFLDERGIFDF
jgi:electron transfer flavoprotein beta subunit